MILLDSISFNVRLESPEFFRSFFPTLSMTLPMEDISSKIKFGYFTSFLVEEKTSQRPHSIPGFQFLGAHYLVWSVEG